MIFFENLEGEGGEERPPSEEDHSHDGEDQVTPAPMHYVAIHTIRAFKNL